MSVRKKLEKKNDPVDVDALIEKGAKVKEDHHFESKKWTYVNLRILSKILQEVDEVVETRVGISRNTWILEAIHEKLKRSND